MKKQIVFSGYILLLFIVINLSYLWEENSGTFALYWSAFLTASFLLFGFIQLIIIGVILFKKKFERKRILLNLFNITLLVVLFLYPQGIIKPNEKRAVYLEAFREGAANCTTALYLFENKELNVCFGLTSAKGTYEILNDTVYFKTTTLPKGSDRYYDFATIQTSTGSKEIVRYYENDSLSYPLSIVKKK